jgi:cytochrome c biogenesis protein CcdA
MKATRILLLSGLVFLAAIFVVGIYVVPKLQVGSSATPRQSDSARVSLSDVFVDVTYATPQFVKRVKLEPYVAQYQNRAQPFLVGINTHVGTIADLDLRGKVLLEDSHGERFPSLGTPVVLSEHHNMYLLVFPLVDNNGKSIFAAERKHFRLIVRDVGRTAERCFDWNLPVVEPEPVRNLASTLMLVLSVVGALMVILSPCAIELTTYYTGIIAGVVSSAALAEHALSERAGVPGVQGQAGPAPRGDRRIPPEVRGRILTNLAAFVMGFTVLYMASGATVALMGRQLMNLQTRFTSTGKLADPICTSAEVGPATPVLLNHAEKGGLANHGPGFGEWARYANWVGSGFLLFFALKSVGVLSRGGRCFVWLAQLGRKFRMVLAAGVGLVSPRHANIIRAPALSMRQPGNITPLNSFCAGLGLSVSCLTCMGGAILYPLLIFVGTSTWYWGALILGTYSLALAIPMAAIAVAVGNYAWQFVHRPVLMRSLQWSGASVMIVVAVLIAFDRTRVINSVVFTLLTALGGQPGTSLASL